MGSSLGLGIGIGAHFILPESPLVKGIKVGHHAMPNGAAPGSWLRDLGGEIRERSIEFRLRDESGVERTWGYTFGDIGVDIDIGKTMAAASRVGHEGSLMSRIREANAAKRGEIDIPYSYKTRRDGARHILEDLAPEFVIEPVDAKLDIQGRRKIPDIVGRELDVEATLTSLEDASYDGDLTIDLVMRPRKAKVTVDTLVGVDLEKIASSFETTFHTFGSGRGRAVNIKNAAGFLDGTVLMPGDVLSFNEKVGARTLERGFTWAPEIQNDELTTGVGGGTCQVSTTLFGAALFGALEIVERRNHSRPSSYTKLGLDATVIYNLQDLKIKNVLPFPIMIHAFLPTPEKIRVELLGGDPVADVTYTFGIGSSSDFMRRITYKPFLQPGTKILRQKGGRGYDVQSLVTVKYKVGRTDERQFFSQYRPTPEVYWIGPGFDERELPPLPDHAKGIEGRATEFDTYPAF